MYKQYEPEILDRVHQMEKEILKCFIAICEKYQLRYFAAFGTLLGTIRHQGFIPWDDDVDVAMPREDYERFLAVAQKECGDAFFLQTVDTDPNYHLFFAKLRMRDTVFIEETLQKAGSVTGFYIDIFPYDAVPDDEREMKRQISRAERLEALLSISKVREPQIGNHGWFVNTGLKVVWKVLHFGAKLLRADRMIWKKCQQVFTRYQNAETQRLTCFCMEAERWLVYTKEIDELCSREFEDILVKVPAGYDAILRRNYGAYMELPPPEERVNHRPVAIKFPKEAEIRYEE